MCVCTLFIPEFKPHKCKGLPAIIYVSIYTCVSGRQTLLFSLRLFRVGCMQADLPALMSAHTRVSGRVCLYVCTCTCFRQSLPLCLHMHVFPAKPAFMSAHARVSGKACLYVCTCTCFRQSLPLCLHIHAFPAKSAFMSAHARVFGRVCFLPYACEGFACERVCVCVCVCVCVSAHQRCRFH